MKPDRMFDFRGSTSKDSWALKFKKFLCEKISKQLNDRVQN